MLIGVLELQVRPSGSEEAPSPLRISLTAPVQREGSRWEAVATVACPFFTEDLKLGGEDSLEALLSFARAAYGFLSAKEREGFDIFMHEPGDLNYNYIWGTHPLEHFRMLEAAEAGKD